MADDLILLDSPADDTAVLRLNRPDKRNALSVELIERLTQQLDELAADAARRVVILRGEGSCFCAGLDLAEAADPATAGRAIAALRHLYETIVASPLVVIAAAHGAAVGGGAGLVLAADLAIASEDLQLGFPEVVRGLVPALVAALLLRRVSDRRARAILLPGRTLDAESCYALGLVGRVVSRSRLEADARAEAENVTAGGPDATAATKRLLNDLAPPLPAAFDLAERAHAAGRTNGEAAEGIAAFREKRSPNWGRRNG